MFLKIDLIAKSLYVFVKCKCYIIISRIYLLEFTIVNIGPKLYSHGQLMCNPEYNLLLAILGYRSQ